MSAGRKFDLGEVWRALGYYTPGITGQRDWLINAVERTGLCDRVCGITAPVYMYRLKPGVSFDQVVDAVRVVLT